MSSNCGYPTECIIILLWAYVFIHKWMDYFTEEDENYHISCSLQIVA